VAKEFRSSDLQLSAYLAARGYRLAHLEGSPDRHVFVFYDVPPSVVLREALACEQTLESDESHSFDIRTRPVAHQKNAPAE